LQRGDQSFDSARSCTY